MSAGVLGGNAVYVKPLYQANPQHNVSVEPRSENVEKTHLFRTAYPPHQGRHGRRKDGRDS